MVRSLVEESGGVAIGRVVFDRPEMKNALTPEMLAMFIAAIERFSGDGRIGAVVVEGNGAAFSAGFDLTLCATNSDALRTLLSELSRAIAAMRACRVPIVLAAHGAALAGGCAMFGGAEVVVTHTEAKIGYPAVRLGISPAVSGPYLAKCVGYGRARERLLDAAPISGWEALRIGLVHECLPDAGKVRDRAAAIARELAGKPSVGIIATKRLMNELERESADDWAARSCEASLSIVDSPEERSRLEALWKK